MHEGVIGVYELLHDEKNFYIVTELVEDGDIKSYMQERIKANERPMDECHARIVAKQLLTLLKYFHQESFIAHKEIKIENILINKENYKIRVNSCR